ncbi:MAG: hypothetical protein GY857_01975 [Desulfobacula sp.]|nr:hypothetical protein [Desulfobacula sp.]
MDEFDDYLLEEDDALDCILYNEIEKEDRDSKGSNKGNTGCSIVLLVIASITLAFVWGAVKIGQAVL